MPAEQFAEPQHRRASIEDKGLTVFSLWSPAHPATEIDLFVEEPFPFDEAYARASRADPGKAWRELSFAQRLAWLWQAKLFARRALGRARPPTATK